MQNEANLTQSSDVIDMLHHIRLKKNISKMLFVVLIFFYEFFPKCLAAVLANFAV